MMHMFARAALCCFCVVLLASYAAAQTVEGWDCKQWTMEGIDADRVRLMRDVECNGEGPNKGHQLFADDLIYNRKTGELESQGNVLLVSPTARITAERVVFNNKTGLATFYTASGSASLGERGAKDRSMFGTLEPDIYFWGETIEKIDEDKYRITNGSFTTCVQPTPRWDIGTGTATINLEDYAILKNAVVRVKDVPVFYLPVIYYPIQSDDRATGFLLPTYGTSTFRGQSLSNAFFWAINRSQDLTLMHDWFTKTGQGYGSEYRYMLAPGSEGYMRAYRMAQNEVVNGATVVLPAETSYEVRGAIAQSLPAGFRARLNVDYFSSLPAQQLYNANIYYASRSQRTVNGSVTGAWGGVNLTGTFQRSEVFTSQTQSTLAGYAPSFSANLSSKRLGSLPVYVATTGEAARYLYLARDGAVENDFTLARFDVNPTVRAALTSLPFLTFNASLAFRDTYFTESYDERLRQVPVGLNRHYFDMRADVVGPTFSRVFNRPASRLKHVIEPVFNVQRVTAFDDQLRVPHVGGSSDYVVGGVTRMSYGIGNRVLVRTTQTEEGAPPASTAPREMLNVSITQSYYTDPLASQFDVAYPSARYRRFSSFSPIALTARTSPTQYITGTLRMEFDQLDGSLRTFQVNGSSTHQNTQVNVGWSKANYDNQQGLNTLNASTTLNFYQGRTGGTYALDWDIGRGYIIQQRWIGFYSAQCCGFGVEYQQFKFPTSIVAGIPQDRRFNISFTLAGIGTFSNFFGAFGGGRF
jgi:hypothetical protein